MNHNVMRNNVAILLINNAINLIIFFRKGSIIQGNQKVSVNY